MEDQNLLMKEINNTKGKYNNITKTKYKPKYRPMKKLKHNVTRRSGVKGQEEERALL